MSVWRMARPWSDPRSGVMYLRQRTPDDVLPRVKGRTINIPIGDDFARVKICQIIQVSLRTKDPVLAKERHAKADAFVRQYFAKMRPDRIHGTASPSELMPKQLPPMDVQTALELYGSAFRQMLIERGEEPTEFRLTQLATSAAYQIEDMWNLPGGIKSRRRISFRDGVFSSENFVPKVEEKQKIALISVLWDSWKVARHDKLAASTVNRYSPSINSFIAFSKDVAVDEITSDMIYNWAIHRRDLEGISAATINKNDLVAMQSVLGWATGREAGQILAKNPVDGVKLDEPRRLIVREKSFRDNEIRTILTAALAVPDSTKYPEAARACHRLSQSRAAAR